MELLGGLVVARVQRILAGAGLGPQVAAAALARRRSRPIGPFGAAMSPFSASAASIRGRSCPVISTWRGLEPS